MDQDFNRPTQPAAYPAAPQPPVPTAKKRNMFLVAISICLLLVLALSIVSIILASTKADKNAQSDQLKSVEKRLKALEDADQYTEQQVDGNTFQAVFLSTGQTYFGKITEANKDTIKLEDIYYLKTGTVDKEGNPIAAGDVSLVKLGSELHAPEDVMFIERKNLSFWENLKTDGQVAKAIKAYKLQNPR